MALELEVFETLREPANIDTFVSRTGFNERGSSALLAMLKSLDLLDRHDGQYTLNNLSRTYMLKESPYFWGPFFAWSTNALPNYKIFLENIRDGETAEEREAADGWESGQMDPEFARTITDYMHCHSIASAVSLSQTCDFSAVKKLMDVGGGSGCYTSAIANANPGLFGTIMELPPVCKD